MQRDYLSRFFLPSPKWTRAFLAAHRVSDEVERLDEGADLLSERDPDFEAGEPEPEAVEFGGGGSERPTPVEDLSAEEIDHYQRLVAERLYRYLAFLARSARHSHRLRYDLNEVIVESMKALLGLERASLPLLSELADEFRERGMMRWPEGRYEAPWGEVRRISLNSFILTASKREAGEPRRGYERAALSTRGSRR